MNAPDSADSDSASKETGPAIPRSSPTASAPSSEAEQFSKDLPSQGELPSLDRGDRLAHVFNTMSEGLIVQDSNGVIYECNAAAEIILGLTRDQITGLTSMDPLWRAIYPDGRPFPGEEHPATVALRTGRSVRGVEMGIDTSGHERRWISINAEPLRNSSD